MRMIPITIAIATTLAVFSSPAAADPATIRIPISQSDLQSPAAVAALHARIEIAAEEVCSVAERDTTRGRCIREVTRDAVTRAGLSPLTQYQQMVDSGTAGQVEIAAR